MARALTAPQKALLRSPDLHVNALVTFFLDQGTYRFCDDQAGFDLTDGVNTWIGANALAEAVEIRGSSALAAESVTILCDGNRMAQAGIADPARVLRDILGYLYQQRRVDWALGFRYSYSKDINMIIPAYAGKINSARLIDREINTPEDGARTVSYLEIVLDSLASRYNRSTNRTRSHQDQLEFDSTDNFYSHTQDVVQNERNVYWGKDAPFGSGGPGGSGGGGGGGGSRGGGGLNGFNSVDY
jgi:uncharacterized membrane protein YgcG